MNPENNTPWHYTADQAVNPEQSTTMSSNNDSHASSTHSHPVGGNISWTATEYIEHERGSSWYFLLFLATSVIAGVSYLVTRDYFAVITIVVAGIVLGVFAGRKPKQISYEISQMGLRIGEKSYNYNLFKSFSIIREGKVSSINFLPLKRLMPPVAAYFAPEDEERIVSAIGDYLPYEERKPDATDRLARRLRF